MPVYCFTALPWEYLRLQIPLLIGFVLTGLLFTKTTAALAQAATVQGTVMDIRSIQLSPGVTVANVAQRVSSVSLERSSTGDGQHAIVRGMDKRYNYTLVNGIKFSRPDLKNRYVPFDIFPSDLLGRLVVTQVAYARYGG